MTRRRYAYEASGSPPWESNSLRNSRRSARASIAAPAVAGMVFGDALMQT